LVPVYDRCRTIDLCNFSSQTIWNSPADRLEPAIPLGKQFVAEATDLSSISGRKYDFILASHVLEHIANPLRALEEWQRTLRPNGILLIIVPDKRRTFDHQRPFTTFKHIEADFQNDTPETDLTHLEEILALHDLALDPNAGDASQFRNRCFMNFKVRAMHHHVFTPELLRRMLERVYMKVLSVGIERPHHIIGLAQSNSYQ
jgi:SAM-dependent methyltransferase